MTKSVVVVLPVLLFWDFCFDLACFCARKVFASGKYVFLIFCHEYGVAGAGMIKSQIILSDPSVPSPPIVVVG